MSSMSGTCIKHSTVQDILINIGDDDEEDVSSNATYETAKSGTEPVLSEAVSQSEEVSPNEAVLASDSGRRSEALSQGASASADLEAGEDATNYTERDDGGKSGMPSVSNAFLAIHSKAESRSSISIHPYSGQMLCPHYCGQLDL